MKQYFPNVDGRIREALLSPTFTLKKQVFCHFLDHDLPPLCTLSLITVSLILLHGKVISKCNVLCFYKQSSDYFLSVPGKQVFRQMERSKRAFLPASNEAKREATSVVMKPLQFIKYDL